MKLVPQDAPPHTGQRIMFHSLRPGVAQSNQLPGHDGRSGQPSGHLISGRLHHQLLSQVHQPAALAIYGHAILGGFLDLPSGRSFLQGRGM